MPRIAMVAALALLGGCTERVSYADPDVGAAKAAFGCASPTGEAADACPMLDVFDKAGAVATWPTSDKHTWWGREHCSQMRDDPQTMHFGWLHIMPGEGDTPGFPDAKQDPSKTLPHHAELPTMTVHDKRPDGLEPYRRLLAAAAAGKDPDMSGLDDGTGADALRIWKSLRDFAVKSPPKMRLTKSDSGKTVLANHATVDNAANYVTYVNLREQGGRIYQFKPAADGHCISELHLLR